MKYQVILLTDVADFNRLGYGKYAGTYKIATEIRKLGFSCQVIDNYTYFGIDKLKILLEKFIDDSTVLLGISCALNEKTTKDGVLHWGYNPIQFLNMLGEFKTAFPNLKTVAGGPRIFYSNSSWPNIDYTVISKGENAVSALLKHLTEGADLTYTQLEYSKVIKEVDYPYTEEEFQTSIIQYEPNDIIFPNEALPLEIARGCIFSCAYCKYDLIGKKIGQWTKTADTIRQEMIRNYELFGTTHYNISDEVINESVEKLTMLRDVIRSLPFEVSYTGYARLDLIWRFPEMRELFLESNAKALIFGIETLHEAAGKAIGKGLGPKRIKETLKFCKELWQDKILMSSNFIVGLPYEPKESILETLNYVISDDCPLDIYTFSPLIIDRSTDVASKIEKNPSKYGITMIASSHNKWNNTELTANDITSMVDEIHSTAKLRNMRLFGVFKWYGRAVTLGYDIPMFKAMLNSSDSEAVKYFNDISIKTIQLKDRYYQLLLDSE